MATKKKASKKTPAKSAKPAKKGARRALSLATGAGEPVKSRLQAMTELSDAVCADNKTLPALLKLLQNTKEPIKVRLGALQTLQAASFSVISFEACRADYIAALRAVVADPDPELRQTVLGILSRQNDGFAQQKLLDGLRDPDQALVPPEKALQLLAYDAHTEAFDAARRIVENPPNQAAKREALRLLAADATAAPLLEKVLRDKNEFAELRQVSASALNSINPDVLRSHAREILLDESEYPEIQATSLTALAQFGGPATASDPKLVERAEELSRRPSGPVQQTARQFLNKRNA